MAAIKLKIRRGDRQTLVGQSGSGKTTLALALVETMPRPVLIVDTKWSQTIGNKAMESGWEISEDFPEFRKKDRGVVVWRPSPDELADPAELDAYLDEMVRRRVLCSVYIDELYQLHRNGRAGPGVIGLYTRGREMGFTTLASSQRPAWVSAFCLSEASHYFVMRLKLKSDKKKMAEVTGQPHLEHEDVAPHWFWYGENGKDMVLFQPLDIRKKEGDTSHQEDLARTLHEPKRLIL